MISATGQPGLNFNDTNDSLGNSSGGKHLQIGRRPEPDELRTGPAGLEPGLRRPRPLAAKREHQRLLRALAENHKVEVLQRPQVTALDDQTANVFVGQSVPTISTVNNNALTGQVNGVTFQNVGVQLTVTPRISPDGMVFMQILTEKASLEPEATGIPIFSSPTGQVIRSPIIDQTAAQTTVVAMDGQTIVLGGLITSNKTESHAQVPWLGDIPVIGNLFRYDSSTKERTELLIIMTPHVIRNAADADAIKREEAAKMSWCLCDVTKIYGEAGLNPRGGPWGGGDVKVVYPDQPDQYLPGMQPAAPETLPVPQGAPAVRP